MKNLDELYERAEKEIRLIEEDETPSDEEKKNNKGNI